MNDPKKPLPEAVNIKEDDLVAMRRSGTLYRISNLHPTPYGNQATIHRAIPKVRGKAARRAEKAARRAKRGVGL